MDRVLDAHGRFIDMPSQAQEQQENEATLRREIARMNHENEDMKKRLESLMEELRSQMETQEALRKINMDIHTENKGLYEYKKKYESLVAEIPKAKKKHSHAKKEAELPGQLVLPLE